MQLSVDTNRMGEGQHAIALHSNSLATMMMVNNRPELDERCRPLRHVHRTVSYPSNDGSHHVLHEQGGNLLHVSILPVIYRHNRRILGCHLDCLSRLEPTVSS